MNLSLVDILLILFVAFVLLGFATMFHRRRNSTAVDNTTTASHEEGEEDVEQDILSGAQHFGEETAGEVMIPRVDIVELSISATFDEVMKCVIENNYSRIPVTDESHEKVKGILYVKDLLRFRNESNEFKWQSLLRAPYFIPESKMIDDLLREFQRNKVHIAMVVDEYGSISGMVTMEDILEEIVGEIQDEYDEETEQFQKSEDGSFIFEGKTAIEDFFEAIGVSQEDYKENIGEAETVAGFVLELMNEIPTVGQQIQCKNLSFHVLELQRQRISKIKVNIISE